jgi:putative FmdB family regulatory protein
MPIYAYKCESCGHAKDVLQKISDAPLSDCPACGKPTFSKQLTAAGFQLKGSGWYATDFSGRGQHRLRNCSRFHGQHRHACRQWWLRRLLCLPLNPLKPLP